MKYILEFSAYAKKDLRELSQEIQKRITKKIDYFLVTSNPLRYAKRLTDKDEGTLCFRVGDYRIRFDVEYENTETIINVFSIRHRDEKTYKD